MNLEQKIMSNGVIIGMELNFDIEKCYSELKNRGIDGISPIALEDGAEALAEIEVLLSRGEFVNEEAKNLYNEYVRRKR